MGALKESRFKIAQGPKPAPWMLGVLLKGYERVPKAVSAIATSKDLHSRFRCVSSLERSRNISSSWSF